MKYTFIYTDTLNKRETKDFDSRKKKVNFEQGLWMVWVWQPEILGMCLRNGSTNYLSESIIQTNVVSSEKKVHKEKSRR